MVIVEQVGERSEPPSDKLGGEILFPRARLYVCHVNILLNMYVRHDNHNHAHSHGVRTLALIPGIAQRKPNNNRN